MGDEGKFHRALDLAGSFIRLKLMFRLLHPTIPSAYVEVDNSAQRNNTLFIFEGKSNNEQGAAQQLRLRHLSCVMFHNVYVGKGVFVPYANIRLFYYSFNQRVLIEFSSTGARMNAQKFNDVNQLSELLRKL